MYGTTRLIVVVIISEKSSVVDVIISTTLLFSTSIDKTSVLVVLVVKFFVSKIMSFIINKNTPPTKTIPITNIVLTVWVVVKNMRKTKKTFRLKLGFNK